MPRILIVTNHASVIKLENMVENLAQPSLDETTKFKNSKSSTQLALTYECHSLLSLLHLLTKRTNGREPLVDYSQSHVITSNEYLRIMQQKAMDKEVVEHIQENKSEERQEKQARKTLTMFTTTKKLVENNL
jgi:hypothetical protein